MTYEMYLNCLRWWTVRLRKTWRSYRLWQQSPIGHVAKIERHHARFCVQQTRYYRNLIELLEKI